MTQPNKSEIAVFRRLAGMVHQVVGINVAGLTHEDSLIQPKPAGNCLNWVMGHLISIYHSTLPLLGQEPVMEADAVERYDRGSPPLRDPAEALDFGKLLSMWEETAARVDAGLADLTPEALEQPSPISPDNDPDETIGSSLTAVLFHQAYHAGQTAILRRIAGKEGAIR